MRLSSPAIEHEAPMPPRYTAAGRNVSPPMHWTGVPTRAAELALVVEDLDASAEAPFVHWLIYKIPADSAGLPAGIPPHEQLTTPPGAVQGRHDFECAGVGYQGPAPPSDDGAHRYRFHLFALDEPLRLGAGATKAGLLEAMKGHVLAESMLVVHCAG